MRSLDEILKGSDLNIFLIRCSKDFKYWCENVFNMDIQPFHMEWFYAIQGNNRVAITAPTGFGKTQLVIAYLLWRCWFETDKDFLIVSKAIHQSVKILDRIIDIIDQNELLSDIMPDNTTKTKTWTKTSIKTKTRCSISCKPYSENIKSYHADFVLCDEAASYRDHDVFFRFVVTRTNAKKGKVVCISTPEDITDLMSVLALRKTYWSRTYPAIINGQALWAGKFGLEELEKIRNDIGDEAYQREYMCNPRAQAANAIFPADIIENCFEYESRFTEKKMFEDSTVIIGADFAISSGQDADFDSYIVLEKHNGACYIRHGETHKGFPIISKVDRLVELYQKYGALKIYLDPSSIGAAVLERLRNRGIPVMAPDFTAANRNRMLVSIREMLEDRKVLIPRDINCFITMKFTNTLVQELLAFRETKTLSRQDKTFQSKSKHDDTVMSLALACLGAQNAREFIDYVAI